jgi:hypothetical protein
MLDLTLAKVQPLLAKPPTAAQAPRVSGWLAGLKVLLDTKYGEFITPAVEPLFLMHVADAIQRRLDKTKQMVDSESAGLASIRWNAASSLMGWFLPDEIADMDSVTGGSGTRSYRTAAPDAISFGNMARTFEEEGFDVPYV